MKIPQHVAGLALFLLIVGVSVFIAGLLTEPAMTMRIPPVPIDAPLSSDATATQFVGYEAQFVSLDFINRKSYTTLTLKRRAGDFWPSRLWVYTSFFVPESTGKSWVNDPVELVEPFAGGDEVTLTLAVSCPWCADRSAPRAGYYARVMVTTAPLEGGFQPAAQMDTNIKTAIPVLVQVERKARP